MRIPAPVRFVASLLVLVLIFGACGSLTLGAIDKAQTQAQGNLTDLTFLFQHVGHFLQAFASVLTTATDRNGAPLRNIFVLGLALTVTFCFIAMPIAILLGFILALMSRAKHRIIRVPARAYVEFFRNTPLLVQLLAIYWSLLFLPQWLLNPFTAGVATLTLNYAAYECENIRAGLSAVDRGQGEAASALGLSRWQSLRLVEVPQTIATVLPPVLNDFIYMFKDSSILSLITIIELTSTTLGLTKQISSLSWEFFLTGALIYLAMSLPLGRVARTTEARLKSTTFAPSRDLTGTALQVLVASVLLGLIAYILSDGFSVGQILPHIGQFFAAVGLTLTIMFFVLIVLGGISYLVATLFGLSRRPNRRDTVAPVGEPIALATK